MNKKRFCYVAAELALELAIEKRKVAELETRVKAADMSAAVAKTIQEHLNNTDVRISQLFFIVFVTYCVSSFLW